MVSALRPVAALLFSVALLLMGNGLQGALLPLRASLELYSTFAIGFLASSYYVGFVTGCFGAAFIIRRAGHIRAFTAAVSIVSTTALIHILVIEPLAWWFLRGVSGFCFAVLFTIIESWLNEKSSDANRGTVFSVYTIINLTVITLGQLIMTLGDPAAFPLFAVASVLLSIAAVPVAMTKSAAPEPISSAHVRLAYLYRRSPAACAGAAASGLANGAFWALGPVFAARHAGSLSAADMVAFFLSAVVIGGAIGQWPLGRLSDTTDRRRILMLSAFGAALAGSALALGGELFGGAPFVFGIVFGAFAFPIYAVSVAHMNDNVESTDYVEAASGMLLIFGVAAVAGPVLVSIVAAQTSIDSLFLYTAAIHGSLFVYLWVRLFRREAPDESEQVAFSESVVAAQTVSTVETIPE